MTTQMPSFASAQPRTSTSRTRATLLQRFASKSGRETLQYLFWRASSRRTLVPGVLRSALASGCLALLAACLASGARAEELQPIQGRSIALGPMNGIAYYTNDAAGSRLVATLSSGEGSTPVRVVATLATGQSVTLSVPHGVGQPATEVTFSRQGDRVFVTDSAAVVEAAK